MCAHSRRAAAALVPHFIPVLVLRHQSLRAFHTSFPARVLRLTSCPHSPTHVLSSFTARVHRTQRLSSFTISIRCTCSPLHLLRTFSGLCLTWRTSAALHLFSALVPHFIPARVLHLQSFTLFASFIAVRVHHPQRLRAFADSRLVLVHRSRSPHTTAVLVLHLHVKCAFAPLKCCAHSPGTTPEHVHRRKHVQIRAIQRVREFTSANVNAFTTDSCARVHQ